MFAVLARLSLVTRILIAIILGFIVRTSIPQFSPIFHYFRRAFLLKH